MKSSTPASLAMASAVSGLSPVTMTTRMPMARNRAKRPYMPGLSTSASATTPSSLLLCSTTSGVAPLRATVATRLERPSGRALPSLVNSRSMASGAPLRYRLPSGSSRPLRRVWAVKGMTLAPAVASASCGASSASIFPPSSTMDFPSGVWSPKEAYMAARASSRGFTPGRGKNSDAWRSPMVMVPVLSSSRVSMSPASSTALPLLASTLAARARSMPAKPMAASSAPMVVGIRQTSSEISHGMGSSTLK